jgi:predicted HNH restriction endonuclease
VGKLSTIAPPEEYRLSPSDVKALLTLESALNVGAAHPSPMSEICARLRATYYRALPYDIYLQTEHWQQTRAMALRAFGSRCRWCDNKYGDDAPIHIHHLAYARLGHEDITDLVPLCAHCHARWHREEGD